jgi:hypothetical protein
MGFSHELVHARAARMTKPYAEIGVTSNFSFLRGASHPQEYVQRAAEYDLHAVGIADRNTLAGVVRAHAELKNPELKTQPKLLIGARLVFTDGTPDILAYPRDRLAYGRLCRLLSKGKLRAEKGECHLCFDDLAEFSEGLLLVLMPPYRFEADALANTLEALRGLRAKAGQAQMETSDGRGCYPSPLWGGWLAEGQSGGGKPRQKPRLWQPPPRPPLPDDATHRLRSADPPHKGEGSQLRHVSNREGHKSTVLDERSFVARMEPAGRANARAVGAIRGSRIAMMSRFHLPRR